MRHIVQLVELIFLSPGLFVLGLCTYGLWRDIRNSVHPSAS